MFKALLLQVSSQATAGSAIAQFLLITLVTLIVSWIIRRFLVLQVLSRLGLNQGNRESVAAITSYAFGALLFTVLLQAAGVDLDSLALLAGSLGTAFV